MDKHMNLLVNGVIATTIDDATFSKVLGIYSEEGFPERPIFALALAQGEIEFKKLKEEAAKILMPWQMFLLESSKLDVELARIEGLRHKAAAAKVTKRTGSGSTTSKRILDRLLRLQSYVSNSRTLPKNPFCGSLAGLSPVDAAATIRAHFGIDENLLRKKSKANALAYLVERIENGQVNVSLGVLTNKILPHLPGSRNVYRNTSGFAIRDECLPFMFLPSEINPEERDGRQIYTLAYLVAVMGLDSYEFQIQKDFTVSMLSSKGRQALLYEIASELLMPRSVTAALRGTQITESTRDNLAKDYKLTPTAVVVTLRRRRLLTKEQYDALLPAPPAPGSVTKSTARTPSIEKSVRKFNGGHAYDLVNADFATRKITGVQAQYLLFGGPNRSGFRTYKKKLGL